MQIIETPIQGLLEIQPKVFGDKRGFFLETWQKKRYEEAGIHYQFVQDNRSFSSRGTLRGLHFQKRFPQGKLVSVIFGEVFDVAVDLRRGSNTYGNWFGLVLSAENAINYGFRQDLHTDFMFFQKQPSSNTNALTIIILKTKQESCGTTKTSGLIGPYLQLQPFY